MFICAALSIIPADGAATESPYYKIENVGGNSKVLTHEGLTCF